MSSDLIAQAFGENANLYATVLDTDQDSSPSQLRKAYYRRALKFHPDKNQNDADATVKFQAISLAYDILSDPKKRKEYDETGELHDDDDILDGGANNWDAYFRNLFKRVSMEDIDNFESQYKGSEEERGDVLKYYKKCKGNLDDMLNCVMLSEEVDKKRWIKDFITPAVENEGVKWYKEAIEKTMGMSDEETNTEEDSDEIKTRGEKKKTKKVGKEAKQSKAQAKREREAKEAEELLAKIRGNSMARRENSFNSMIAGIEAQNKKRKPKKYAKDPIDDDEFDRIQKRIDSERKSKNTHKKKRK